MMSGGSSAFSASAEVSTMSGISTANLADVLDVGLVFRIVARLGLEPAAEYLPEAGFRRRPKAESKHVRVVPRPRAARRLRVATEGGTNARDLVRGDRRAGAGPAANDPLLGSAFRYVSGRELARPGPVAALARLERAGKNRVVTPPAQLAHQRVREGRVHVACDRHLHRR